MYSVHPTHTIIRQIITINTQNTLATVHVSINNKTKFIHFMACNSVISDIFVKQKIYLTPLVCKLPFSIQLHNFVKTGIIIH